MINVYTRGEFPTDVMTSITDDIGDINSLERLLAHHGVDNIVTMFNQDEYTIDVVVKYAESHYLAYDVT